MLQVNQVTRIKRAHLGFYGNIESEFFSYKGDRRNFFESENGLALFINSLYGDKPFRYSTLDENEIVGDEYHDFERIFKAVLVLCCGSSSDLYSHLSLLDIYSDARNILNNIPQSSYLRIRDIGPGNLHFLILLYLRSIQGAHFTYIAVEASPVHYCLQNLILNYLSTLDHQRLEVEEHLFKTSAMVDLSCGEPSEGCKAHHVPAWKDAVSNDDYIILSEVLGELPSYDLKRICNDIAGKYKSGTTLIVCGGLLKSLFVGELMYGVGGGASIDILSLLSSLTGGLSGSVTISRSGYTIILHRNLANLEIDSDKTLLSIIEEKLDRDWPKSLWIDSCFKVLHSPVQHISSFDEYMDKVCHSKSSVFQVVLKGDPGPSFLPSLETRKLAIKRIMRYSEMHIVLSLTQHD